MAVYSKQLNDGIQSGDVAEILSAFEDEDDRAILERKRESHKNHGWDVVMNEDEMGFSAVKDYAGIPDHPFEVARLFWIED